MKRLVLKGKNMNEFQVLSGRKAGHIELSQEAQIAPNKCDVRFNYEPMLNAHPRPGALIAKKFMNHAFLAPIWISSMTGGTAKARMINQNLARACAEFGLGMGLGSCRPLLKDNSSFDDFNVRPIIGDSAPLFANLGIAQVERLVFSNQAEKIHEMVHSLKATGLIIHVNPLQEWMQPEGDRLQIAPITTITEFLNNCNYPVIVKEVGQGMGPESLFQLMKLPLAAIEFGAFGGTNFSYLEQLRDPTGRGKELFPLSLVGHTAQEMLQFVNTILTRFPEEVKCREFIISGGVQSFLDGHHLIESCHGNAIYGQAKSFLDRAAVSYQELSKYIKTQIEGLSVAKAYLNQRGDESANH